MNKIEKIDIAIDVIDSFMYCWADQVADEKPMSQYDAAKYTMESIKRWRESCIKIEKISNESNRRFLYETDASYYNEVNQLVIDLHTGKRKVTREEIEKLGIRSFSIEMGEHHFYDNQRRRYGRPYIKHLEVKFIDEQLDEDF